MIHSRFGCYLIFRLAFLRPVPTIIHHFLRSINTVSQMRAARFSEMNGELQPLKGDENGVDALLGADGGSEDEREDKVPDMVSPGLHNARSRGSGFNNTRESMQYHVKALLGREMFENFRNFPAFRNHEPSFRSRKRARQNVVLGILLIIVTLSLLSGAGFLLYNRIYLPIHKAKMLEKAIKAHAEAARIRAEQCHGIDWETACDQMGAAGARRRRDRRLYTGTLDRSSELEDNLLFSDDPAVTYDSNCLRVYRMELFNNITFPYHSSSRLAKGGNYTMALFIQHGAMRNSESYFCSFKKLLLRQTYRPMSDILIIAPDFNYEFDNLVHPRDAFWNSSKPWGDWRVGAESDPRCCGNQGSVGTPQTISSFEVLDMMLATLTDRKLFPRMNKISYVGHSAGGQMVQRYAIISTLAALYDLDDDVDMEFIVANPSSYTYLTPERYKFTCGNCTCDTSDCRCTDGCTKPPYTQLGHPSKAAAGKSYPCYQWNYDRWPYGIGSFSDNNGHFLPYVLRDGKLGTTRALRLYKKLHVVYMVGQNDTCNDSLPTCDASCWKRVNYEKGEWPCFRNKMDTRCPALLQGSCRRTRGHQYMRYLEDLYGQKTHILHTIPGVGHNASAMFGSRTGMQELFGFSDQHK